MLTVSFKTENAAFHDDDATDLHEEDDAISEATRVECARILRHIADQLDNGSTHGRCMDGNGNGVGSWSLE